MAYESLLDEARKNAKEIEYIIDKRVEILTRNCLRVEIMTVTNNPENGLVGVTQKYGKEIKIPYLSNIDFKINDDVLVYYFGSLNNAFVAVNRNIN